MAEKYCSCEWPYEVCRCFTKEKKVADYKDYYREPKKATAEEIRLKKEVDRLTLELRIIELEKELKAAKDKLKVLKSNG